ncbi:MAG TPA: glycosyltransferase family 2 protein [Thermoanaerobaculia bacterium]|nr:glycosyltransferase family 2 protein [Thermoanaerobaculia bacterium]
MAKLSVVMSVFNGAGELPATLASIAAQSEGGYELIVVDDGSTDDTPRILDDAAKRDARIRVITQANAGLTRALIRGCGEARAPVIARHDCGDRSHPERFAKQLALLSGAGILPAVAPPSWQRDPDRRLEAGETAGGTPAVLVACATRMRGPRGEELYVSRANGEAVRHSLLHDDAAHIRGIPHHASAMFRREDYRAAGGYRAEFRFAQDLDLWIRLARRGSFAITDEVLYEATLAPRSISSMYRREQERLTAIAVALRDLQPEGGRPIHLADQRSALLAEAARIAPSRKASARDEAAGLYFIAKCLRDRRDLAWRSYLVRALRKNPLHWRAWASLLLGR